MSGRFAEFCYDGVLRISFPGAMLPVSSLCEPDEGMPWWLAALPIRVSENTSFRSMLGCLRPWKGVVRKSHGIDIDEWYDALRSSGQTPYLTMHIEKHIEMGTGQDWFVFMRGTGSEDMGNPDEMPFDILGKSKVHLSSGLLFVSSSDDGLPLFDGAHSDVFSLASAGRLKTLGAWSDSEPPMFSDFVNNCILAKCIKHNSPFISMEKTSDSLVSCP